MLYGCIDRIKITEENAVSLCSTLINVLYRHLKLKTNRQWSKTKQHELYDGSFCAALTAHYLGPVKQPSC